jgi:hypothetical protein
MLLFSGRPDPEWPVPDDQVTRLADIWAALTPIASGSAPTPKLGYRGVELHEDDDTSYLAVAGLVTKSRAGAAETRTDPGRVFERALIASAPPGTVPPGAPGLDPTAS